MNKICYFFFSICCIFFFSCQKELSNETATTLTASGSLWDSTSACLPDSVHGTFYGGVTPGSDTAYVEIQVDVTQTGSYNITSDQQDGFVFADSGFFSNTGINVIHLKPIGTPIIPTTATFNISFDSSFCSFSVNIEDSTGKGLNSSNDTLVVGGQGTGQWQFTVNKTTYKGSFNKIFTIDSAGYKYAYLLDTTNGFDSAFYFFISFPGGNIAAGTYDIQAASPSLNGFQFYDPINVTSYDPSTHIISGTFNGTANDTNFNPIIPVTNGSFTATLP